MDKNPIMKNLAYGPTMFKLYYGSMGNRATPYIDIILCRWENQMGQEIHQAY